jgi:hypothetical integral membrane protein (TIGR02206 family)
MIIGGAFMLNFFGRIPLDGVSEFELFTIPYFIAVFLSLVSLGIIYYYLPRLKGKAYEPYIRYTIIIYLIFSSLYKQAFFYYSNVPWYMHLPEATCGFSIILGTITLMTKNRFTFVLTFFWGWGAFTALLAPNLLEGPNYYYFYQFFIRHLLIVVSAVYMIRVFDYKITLKDFRTYVVVTSIMVFFGYIASIIINDPEHFNMFYTLHPAVNNPFLDGILDISHTLYLAVWIIIGILFGYIYGLPFYSKDQSSK